MTLVTQEVQKRLKDKEDLKRQQKYDLELHKLNQKQEMHYQNSNAFNDQHIINSMSAVNESDTTFDESLTRMNGNWLFNRNLKPSPKKSLETTIVELTTKQTIEDSNDYDRTVNTLELIKNLGSTRDFLVMESLTKRHNENGQLGVRDKKIRNGLYEKYLQEINDDRGSDTGIQVDDSSVTWRKICEQIDKPRISIDPKVSFFSQLRENLQTKDQNRMKRLKESK